MRRWLQQGRMDYKGFHGSTNFSGEDNCFYGKIDGITDLVSYEADSRGGLRTSFEEAVNDYIELCDEVGE